MNKLLFLSDDEVQSQLATKYDLLVHIGLETFQYAIIDKPHNDLKVLAEYELPKASGNTELIKAIEELPESNRQFKFSFNTIKISYTTTNYTFIPAELYQEDSQTEYAKYVSQGGNKEIIVNNLLTSEIKNITAIDSDFNNALNRIFHRPKIYNQANPYLEGIQRSLTREDEMACFIDVKETHFQVALFKDFRLEFYNSFEYANADEFNYYLLNLIESLNINTEETPIILSGKVSSSDEVYQRMEKYFDNLRFIDAEHLKQYADKFGEVQPYAFFTLFSLELCE